jgi:Protein of unknown function (DUF3306)
MAQDKENPLARWSRLKRESARAAEVPKPAPRAPEAPPPELPPLDQMGPDSDFSAFMDRRVDDGLRRLALKKLFGDPRLNAADGLDVFSEDYSKLEDLPQEMVAKLVHLRRTLRRPDPEPGSEPEREAAEEPKLEQAEAEPEQDDGDDAQDAARRQDT